MHEYAKAAADRVLELRRRISSPAGALAQVMPHLRPGVAGWPAYHAAVLAGLVGEMELARRLLGQIVAGPSRFAWEKELAEQAQALAALDRAAFRVEITRTVVQTRALLKLPPATGSIF